MSQNAVTNALNGLNERIQDIIHSLGTVLEIRLLPDYTISGNPTVDGGLYENGTRIQPSFAWEVWYNGMKLKRKDVSVSIYINGSFYSGGMNNPSEDEDEYTWVWIYNQNISRDTVITLSVYTVMVVHQTLLDLLVSLKTLPMNLLILEFGVNLKQTILVRL